MDYAAQGTVAAGAAHELHFMIGYIFLRLVGELFRLVPFRVLYVLSDGLAFLLYRVAGYRKKVVFENLRRAFPGKSEG